MIRRQREIMYYLMKLDEAIIGEKIAESFAVSIRTIRDDIKKINEEVKDIGVKILSSKDNGYFLTAKDKEKVRKDNFFVQAVSSKTSLSMPETPQERVTYIILKLCVESRIDMYELEEKLFVSISTLQQDLKIAKKLVEDKFYGIALSVKGNTIEIEATKESRMNLLGGIFSQTKDEVLLMKYMNYIFDDTYYNKFNLVYVLLAKMEVAFVDKLTGVGLRSLAFDIIICTYFKDDTKAIEQDYKISSNYIENLKKRLLDIDIHLDFMDCQYLTKRYHSKSFLVKKQESHDDFIYQIMEEFKATLQAQFQIELKDFNTEHKFMVILDTIIMRLDNHYYYDEHFKKEMFGHNPLPFLIAQILENCIKKYTNTNLERNAYYLLASSLSSYLRKNYKLYSVYLVSNYDVGYCDNFSRILEEKSSSKIYIVKYLSSIDYYVNKRLYEDHIVIINNDEFGIYDKNVIGIEKVDISKNEIDKIEAFCVEKLISELEIEEVESKISDVQEYEMLLSHIASDLKVSQEVFSNLIKNKIYKIKEGQLIIPFVKLKEVGIKKYDYYCACSLNKQKINKICILQIGKITIQELNALSHKFLL